MLEQLRRVGQQLSGGCNADQQSTVQCVVHSDAMIACLR
jgi:hypothetical protein